LTVSEIADSNVMTERRVNMVDVLSMGNIEICGGHFKKW
jgi:hypothetical protein